MKRLIIVPRKFNFLFGAYLYNIIIYIYVCVHNFKSVKQSSHTRVRMIQHVLLENRPRTAYFQETDVPDNFLFGKMLHET